MDEAIWVHNHDYVINPAHVPPHLRDPKKDPLMAGMSPQDRYNPGKSVLPPNHKEAWDNSVPDPKAPNSTRWSKEGNGKKSVFHKFFGNHQDTWHWVGSTINETLSGKPRIVPQNQIPQSVKNQIGF